MKRINMLLVCAVVCATVLSLSGFMFQQIPDKEERIQAINDFRQQFGDEMRVRVRPETGIPASIHGQRITKYQGTPEQIAREFLTDEKKIFGIRDPQLDIEVVKSVYSEKLGTIITFEQRYNRIPVLYSCYIIGVDNYGSIYCINGRYFPDVQLDTNPNITAVQAAAVVENDLSGKSVRYFKEPQLSIYPEEGTNQTYEYNLIYNMTVIANNDLEEWEYYIDAITGSILIKRDLTKRVISGTGSVYKATPVQREPESVVIHRLDEENNPRKLDGENVIVYNDETSEASSSTAEFFYDPENTHFDEVMGYYHVDEFKESFLDPLGAGSIGKATVYTHNETYYALVTMSNRKIYLADSGTVDNQMPGYRDPAKESTIIAHEYMHIVTYSYEKGLSTDYEAKAMDEGYCDYFSVAYKNWTLETDNIHTTGEYVNPPYERILDNSFSYPEDYDFGDLPEVKPKYHENSQIFSGAMWDVRNDNDTDEDDVNEIMLASLYYLVYSPEFLDGEDALIEAAEQLLHTDYVYNIVYACYEHGIGDPPSDPPSVSIYGVTSMYTDESKQWTAYIEDGESPFTYQWKRKDFGTETWNKVSTTYYYTYDYPDTSFYLKLNIIDYYGRPDSTTITVTVTVRPLDVEIDGNHLPYAYWYQNNEWWAETSYGTPPYNTFAWYMRVWWEEHEEWCEWESVGSDSIHKIYDDEDDWYELEELFEEYGFGIGSDFQLKVVVTDNAQDSDEDIIDLEVGELPKKLGRQLPKDFKLEQNYPNPFNPVTTINFQLPKASNVTLVIYNIQGQEVARLVDGNLEAGYHSVPWKPVSAASGIYIYRLQAGNFSDIKRMLYIK